MSDNSNKKEVAIQRCSLEKVFWKYVANLQENTHVEVWFQKSCKADPFQFSPQFIATHFFQKSFPKLIANFHFTSDHIVRI